MAKATIKKKGATITIEGSPKEITNVINSISSKEESKTKDKEKIHSKGKISITDRLVELKETGFFNKPKMASEIKEKLATRGYHYPTNSLTAPLLRAVRAKVLGRVKTKDGNWGYAKR